MANVKIRDMIAIPSLTGGELIEVDNLASVDYNTNVNQVSDYANTSKTYSGLTTTSKNIVGGINEVKAAVATKINSSEKGAANGVATLDSAGKVPLTQISEVLLGAVNYQGTWDASGGVAPTPTSKGYYWVMNVAGTISSIYFNVGDWLIYNSAGVIGKLSSSDVWMLSGSDVITAGSSRNVNLGTAGLKDSNVTTAVKLGDSSNTSLSTTNKTLVGGANELYTLNRNKNSGVITLPSLTDNLNGSVTIGANGVANFYTSNDITTAQLVRATMPTGATITLTDGAVNAIYAVYNSGAPTYTVTTNPTIFLGNATYVPCYRIIREGTELHVLDFGNFGFELAGKSYFKDIFLSSFKRQSGLTLSTAATRISTISLGSAWFGVDLNPLATNTAGSAGALYEYYPIAGVWNRSTVTAYDSSYYSDGTNRQTLSANRYVAKYFFRGVETDNHAYYIHGNQYTNISGAINEILPAAPSVVTAHALYVGKIVIQQGATNGTSYPRDWEGSVVSAGVTNHEDLTNILQAGTGITNGHISAAAQTIAGDKTFSGTTSFSGTVNYSLLTASTLLSLDASKNVLSKGIVTVIDTSANIPTSGAVKTYVDAQTFTGYWNRSGVDLTPKTAGDNVNLGTGGLKNQYVTTAIKLGDASNITFGTSNQTIVGAVNELQSLKFNKSGGDVTGVMTVSGSYFEVSNTMRTSGTAYAGIGTKCFSACGTNITQNDASSKFITLGGNGITTNGSGSVLIADQTLRSTSVSYTNQFVTYFASGHYMKGSPLSLYTESATSSPMIFRSLGTTEANSVTLSAAAQSTARTFTLPIISSDVSLLHTSYAGGLQTILGALTVTQSLSCSTNIDCGGSFSLYNAGGVFQFFADNSKIATQINSAMRTYTLPTVTSDVKFLHSGYAGGLQTITGYIGINGSANINLPLHVTAASTGTTVLIDGFGGGLARGIQMTPINDSVGMSYIRFNNSAGTQIGAFYNPSSPGALGLSCDEIRVREINSNGGSGTLKVGYTSGVWFGSQYTLAVNLNTSSLTMPPEWFSTNLGSVLIDFYKDWTTASGTIEILRIPSIADRAYTVSLWATSGGNGNGIAKGGGAYIMAYLFRRSGGNLTLGNQTTVYGFAFTGNIYITADANSIVVGVTSAPTYARTSFKMEILGCENLT